MENATQADRLCELLLDRGPGCSWLLDRDMTFVRVFGNSLPLFQCPAAKLAGARLKDVLPAANSEYWRERVARVFAGETLLSRERTASSQLFSVTHFPVRVDGPEVLFSGGTALEVTPFLSVEQELRHTALDVIRTQESERARLARFLHDEVGQCLSAVGLQLDLLRMDTEGAVPEIPARTREVQQLLESMMERVREFSYELDPAMVERAGLYSALDRMVGRVRRSFPGTVRLMADSTMRFDPAVAGALYKIAEQAVDNSVRHSGCSLLEVLLKSTHQGPTLEVRDNGRGFDASEMNGRHRGLGLFIMKHCAGEAGVILEITSVRGRGTTIKAVVRRRTAPAMQ